MVVLTSLIFVVFQVFLVQSKSILPEAIKYAAASSFNESAGILHIVVETDVDKNKETFVDAIDNILLEDWTFRIQIDLNNQDGKAVSDHNLWFIDSYEAFRHLLPWIPDYHKDSQLFYFIVLKSSKLEDSLNEIQKIFLDFLELMIGNVNIIIETASGEILFYTFYPFQEFACRSTKPFISHRFTNNSTETLIPFFPPKADNFHGCPLRIGTRNELLLRLVDLELPGKLANYDMSVLELIIVKEFAYRMNFSLEIYNITDSASVLINETTAFPAEIHEMITDDKTNLIVGFYGLDHSENYYLSKSVAYYFSWKVICSRPRLNTLRLHGWLFVPFNITTWIYTVVTFILITGCITLARKSKRLRGIFHLQVHYPGGFEILSVAIGTSVAHLSKNNSLRFSFVILSLGALVLRAAYQGKLFDAYCGRTTLKSPHSIWDLFAENYTIYAYEYHRSVLNDEIKLEYPEFLNSREVLLLTDINILDADHQNAIVASYIFIFTFYTAEERKNLIVAPVLIEQICMFLKQHSVIQPRMNDIIMRMEEAGFLDHLRQKFENLNNAGFYQDDHNGDEPRPLVLERLTFTFYLWGGLCTIACFIFVGELMWH